MSKKENFDPFAQLKLTDDDVKIYRSICEECGKDVALERAAHLGVAHFIVVLYLLSHPENTLEDELRFLRDNWYEIKT